MGLRSRWISLGLRRKGSRAVAFGLTLLAFGAVGTLGAAEAPAQDAASPGRDLQTSDDFRVRVSSALTLGRSHAAGALGLLVQALNDSNAAVRTAAAAGLTALNDRGALPALRQRLSVESSAGARSQLMSAIAALDVAVPGALSVESGGDRRWQGTRYVVALGDMRNRSGVRGDHASEVLRSATKTHAQSIPGALVAEGDPALLQQAATRHVPVLLIDGSLQRLSMGRKNAQLSYSAQVDFSMRRVPEQQLRGMLSGSATSFGSVNSLHDPGVVALLEDQAIDGAVESALRGAAQGFGDAVRGH